MINSGDFQSATTDGIAPGQVPATCDATIAMTTSADLVVCKNI